MNKMHVPLPTIPSWKYHSSAAGILLCSLIFAVLMVSVETSAGAVPVCSPEFEAVWQIVRQEASGVWASDNRRWIDERTARRYGFSNWFPVDGSKEVACGDLSKWSFYWGLGEELDLHPYIRPSDHFAYLLNDINQFSYPQSSGILYGEVTPPEDFRKAFWGGGRPCALLSDCQCNEARRCNDGNLCCEIKDKYEPQAFCMYGPWVTEKVHHWRPEIHPVQQFWGQRKGVIDLFFLKDTSQRFEKEKRFARRPQSDWHAWSEPLGNALFYVAFAAALNQDSPEINLIDPASSELNSKEPFVIGDRTIAVSKPADVTLKAGSVCRTQSETLLGYLLVEVPAPSGRRELQLTRNEPGIVQPVTQSSPSAPETIPSEANGTMKPIIQIDDVESRTYPVTPLSAKWPKTKIAWGLEQAEAVDWKWASAQRLKFHVTYEGSEAAVDFFDDKLRSDPDFMVSIEWSFEAKDLETGQTVPVVYNQAASEDHVAIELWATPKVKMTIADQKVHIHKAFTTCSVWIGFPSDKKGGISKFRSVAVEIHARMKDAAGNLGELETPSAMSFSPGERVAGAGFKPSNVSGWPDAVRDRLLRWLCGKILKTCVAELERDWRFDNPNSPTPPAAEIPAERQRRARILRLYGRTATEDGLITTSEWRILQTLAKQYVQSKKITQD